MWSEFSSLVRMLLTGNSLVISLVISLVSTIPVKFVVSEPASVHLCPRPARLSQYRLAPIRQAAHRVPGALG